MPCAGCQTDKKSYSNHALRKCNYSPLFRLKPLSPARYFLLTKVFFSFPSFSYVHVLSDFPFQFLYFLFSSQLCLSVFFFSSNFGFCKFLPLIWFFSSPSWYFFLFALTCCSLFHCPLLSLSEAGKSNKDCFFFPIFISADKNMVPMEHLYNILKIWATFSFLVTSCLPQWLLEKHPD